MPHKQAQATCQWLAYELHDGLLQWIISAKMQAEHALSTGKQPEKNPANAPLRSTVQLLELALDEGRQLIRFLENQPTGTPIDLIEAIKNVLDDSQTDANRNGQRLTFDDAGLVADVDREGLELSNLAPPTNWNLLRIVQQSVRNAIQHAGPCEIAVRLSCPTAGRLRIEVIDTGVGFEPESREAEAQQASHFGMASIRHRASLLGAGYRLSSHPGSGTTLTVELSISHSG